METIEQAAKQLRQYCQRQGYAGWDPFDGLNSKLFQASQMHRSAFLRLCWLQLFKRSPINLRAITLTPKTLNAKAVSLFLRAAIARGDEAAIHQHYQQLMGLQKDASQWGGAAWGYPFDWQAKAFFVPKETPNVICTAYAVRALRELQAVRSDLVDESVFAQAAAFVKAHLLREGGDVAYVPTSDALVYNASLWGAYVCLQGDEEAVANTAIDHALAAQAADGSWLYGTAKHHGFIDGFHTGYNLEALHLMNDRLARADVQTAIEEGMRFYLQHCFEADGTAKYYTHNRYPLDPHAAAQGILTLLSIDAMRYYEQAAQIAQAAIANLWNTKTGCFAYQRHAGYQNNIAYMRWTQAWMLLALEVLLQQTHQK